MNEIEKIVQTREEWNSKGKRMALATVVSIQGSAYRRPGARMLISEQGESIGMIGGGCFDSDVKEIGYQVIHSGQPELHLYEMAGADPWGLGMGCTGSVYVLVEAMDRKPGMEWVAEVEKTLLLGGNLVVVHRFSRPIDHRTAEENGVVRIEREYRRVVAGSKERDTAAVVGIGEYTFQETIEPSPRLVVFGSGNDVVPLVEYASNVGFRVIVVDQQEDLLNHGRFPRAAGFIQAWPDHYADKIVPAAGDYVVLISHRLENDAEAFRLYSAANPAYIGFLGPKSRTERILHEMVKIDHADLESIRHAVHAPIGLDLGAETAEEVAMSIAAELLAVKNRCSPKFLRDKLGAIHDERVQARSGNPGTLAAVAAGPVRTCGI
jgi:xanthine dehydrogenase accessory factor